MTKKEKAKEFIEFYWQYVNGYVGSSMLTNTEYPEVILKNAKICAIKNVNDILSVCRDKNLINFYEDVRQAIENYKL